MPHRASVDVGALSLLAGACRDAERLRFDYRAREAEVTQRRVEPAGLVSAGFRWYLVAWDLGRGDWRTFRVDRIAGSPVRGESFVPRPPPAGGLSAYVAKSVAIESYGVKARVRLHAPASEIGPKLSWYGRVESDGPRQSIVTAGAPSIEALAAWMSTLGVEFEVLEPAGAARALAAMADRIRRAGRAAR